MKTQFTPGPWRVNSPYIEDQHGTIAKVMRPEANAALIAAAPDLFEALHDALIYVTDCIDCSDDKKLVAAAKKHEQKILAALAKAKGELC